MPGWVCKSDREGHLVVPHQVFGNFVAFVRIRLVVAFDELDAPTRGRPPAATGAAACANAAAGTRLINTARPRNTDDSCKNTSRVRLGAQLAAAPAGVRRQRAGCGAHRTQKPRLVNAKRAFAAAAAATMNGPMPPLSHPKEVSP